MKFKIHFPAGYQQFNIDNGNLDANIILETGDVYFCTIFTLSNIRQLMNKEESPYFWAMDMLIVDNLKKKTINAAVERIIDEKNLDPILCKIGTIEEIYGEKRLFSDFDHMGDKLKIV